MLRIEAAALNLLDRHHLNVGQSVFMNSNQGHVSFLKPTNAVLGRLHYFTDWSSNRRPRLSRAPRPPSPPAKRRFDPLWSTKARPSAKRKGDLEFRDHHRRSTSKLSGAA